MLGRVLRSLDAGVSVNSEDRPVRRGEKGVLKTSCVTLGTFSADENKVVAEAHEVARLREPVRGGTIVISRMNTPTLVGANAYVPDDRPDLFLPDRLWAASVAEDASAPWVGHLLGHPATREALSERASGTSGSMKNLSKPSVMLLPIALPTLPEQRKIAAFLSAVDARIAAAGRERAGLGRFKAGLLQGLFSRALRFAPEGGGAFPDWEERRLGEVALSLNSGGTPSSGNKAFWDGSIPWITGADFGDNRVVAVRRHLTPEGLARGSHLAKAGDLLVVTRTGVGKVAVAQSDVAVSQDITAVRLKPVISTAFAFQFLSSHPQALRRLNQGTSIAGVTRDDVEAAMVPLPHLDEQARIAAALSALDHRLDLAAREEAALRRFKAGLLQAMFV